MRRNLISGGSIAIALAVSMSACVATSGPRRSAAEPESVKTAPAMTATTAPATTSPVPATPFVTADAGGLTLGGAPYRPIGINAFQLATRWGQNMGCGGMLDDAGIARFFASLPEHALVRFWAWQGSMATNPATHQRDWRPLDRVVAAAEQHHVVLIASLGSQAGDCDDGRWKDPAWYEGGYRDLGTGDGYSRATVPYPDYVSEIVTRYRNSPGIGMWEPMNEPEASTCPAGLTTTHCYGHLTCPDAGRATSAIRRFYDEIGGLIHSIDRNHLIESGSLGGPQCGWAGAGFSTITASPGIDVASFHAYGAEVTDQRPLAARVTESTALGKPVLVGETAMEAGPAGCRTRAERDRDLGAAIDAMLAVGAAGVAMWNATHDPQSGCTYDISPDDPLRRRLRGS